MHSLKRLEAEDATSASVCLYVFFWNLRVFVEIYTYSIGGGHNTQKTTLYLFSQRKMQMDLWSPWFPVLISRELTGAGWSCIPEWLAGSLRRVDINTALISENMTQTTDPTGRGWVDTSGPWQHRIFPTRYHGVSWPEPRPTVLSPSHADFACWRSTSSCLSPAEPPWMWSPSFSRAALTNRSSF